MKIGSISISTVPNNGYRIDPSLHLSEGVSVRAKLSICPYGLVPVSKCSSKIFIGNIFSRVFVGDQEYGIPYLSASETVRADLETGRFLSKKQAAELNYLMLEKDWILITCSGTLGNVSYTNKNYCGKIATHDLIRIVPSNTTIRKGCLFAFLASKYGYFQITQSQFGGVVKHINESQTGDILVPKFPDELQKDIDELVLEAARLREEATEDLKKAEKTFKRKADLRDLVTDDYDYFGHRSNQREVSCFTRSIQDIGTTTINAFNHSERIRKLKASMTCKIIPLKDALKEGRTYGTSGLPNIEVKPGHGIMLINQKDMFDNIVKGKWISSRGSDPENVLEYGEILIACDGTLGENELFCRAVFANEDLKGSYVSSHFLRLKVNDEIPSGYLYCWLNSDYGFRLIRNTQAGTKLCHPINKLFLDIPVPIVEKNSMLEIDRLVREAHTKRHQANQKELKAISMVEQEIEKWNN
jgi:restriction endonuclease S subunit